MAKNNQANPKNEKAAQARAAAQAQVRAKERRTSAIVIVGSVVVLALFAWLVYFIVNSNKAPALDETSDAVPSVATENGGIPVGTTGIVDQDMPTDAIRVDIYEDYLCPVCNVFEQVNHDDIQALREDGTIELYVHPVSILDSQSAGTAYSTRAASAAATVAEGAPEFFVAFADALFANQPAEGGPGLTDEQLATIAVGVGVPQEVADSIADQKFTRWVGAATERASQDGMGGTPTVIVDGVILNPQEVFYINQPGALRAYIESVAGA